MRRVSSACGAGVGFVACAVVSPLVAGALLLLLRPAAAGGALPSCGLQAANTSMQTHKPSAAAIEINKRIPFALLKNISLTPQHGTSHARTASHKISAK
jgi:hypothetical protein